MGNRTRATTLRLATGPGRAAGAGVGADPPPVDLAVGADEILARVRELARSGRRNGGVSLAAVQEITDELRAFQAAVMRATAGPVAWDTLDQVLRARRRVADAQLIVLGLLAGGAGLAA